MVEEGIQPTAASYGNLFTACRKLGDVERASSLYRQACDSGVLPNDECHNILINIYADAGRLNALPVPCPSRCIPIILIFLSDISSECEDGWRAHTSSRCLK